MMYEKLSVKDLWKYCHVWPDDNPYDVHKLVAEAAEAIEKLQSELKQVKVEREALLKEKAEREKGCEWCDDHNYKQPSEWIWGERIHIIKPHYFCVGDGIAHYEEAEYCPKCGRKLVSEE